LLEYIIAGSVAGLFIGNIVASAYQKVNGAKMIGNRGERKVRRALSSFRSKDYAKLHNILLPGGLDSTQIDHVFVSRFCIIPIETKNYSGKILGAASWRMWKQVFPRSLRQDREFLNPLIQNKTHARAVQALLAEKYPHVPVYSLVVFSDRCEVPAIPNVIKMRQLKLAIKARCHGQPILSREEVQDIKKILKENSITKRKARRQHDAKAHLAAEAAKHVTPGRLEQLQEQAKDAPFLYLGEKITQRELPPEYHKLTDAGALLTIHGKTESIADIFESAKRDEQGRSVPYGSDFHHFICPYTGNSFPKEEAKSLYQGLWISYLNRSPQLIEYMEKNGTENLGGSFRCNKVLNGYTENRAAFISQARNTPWYRNMKEKQKAQKAAQQNHRPLDDQIQNAQSTPHYTPHHSTDHTPISH